MNIYILWNKYKYKYIYEFYKFTTWYRYRLFNLQNKNLLNLLLKNIIKKLLLDNIKMYELFQKWRFKLHISSYISFTIHIMQYSKLFNFSAFIIIYKNVIIMFKIQFFKIDYII